MKDALDPALFIGSSREGKSVADYLQVSLDKTCQTRVWDQGVFGPSSTAISSLLEQTRLVDFAVLVMTPDDMTLSRERESASARDNVVFELGLFMGALGAERVFIVAPRGAEMRFPSDLAGVTRLEYRSDQEYGDLEAALGPASTKIKEAVQNRGKRREHITPPPALGITDFSASRRGLSMDEERALLAEEIEAIKKAAAAQGWTVKTHSSSALRLESKNKRRYSLSLVGDPATTRDNLRDYALQLKDAGLRISQRVLQDIQAP